MGIREKLRKVPALQALRHPYKTIAEKNEVKRCAKDKERIKNHTPTFFSNDCISGVFMKNYELPCKSPMINCAMWPDEYVRYLKNIEHYRQCELVEKPNTKYDFPVGELVSEEFGNIEIRFMHYASFTEAKKLWKRRSKRIDLSNMNVMLDLNPYMQISEESVNDFINLPYNKVIITTEAFKDTPCSYFIDVGNKIMVKGIMLKYKNLKGERYYDDFDIVEWLNKNAE